MSGSSDVIYMLYDDYGGLVRGPLLGKPGLNMESLVAEFRSESYAKAEWAPKNVTVVSYQTQDQIYQDLVTNRLDAAFQAAVQADFGFLKTPQGKGFALVGKPVGDSRVAGDVAIGIRKGDTPMETQINQAIAAIRQDGVYQQVAAKYFNFNIYGD